MRTNLKLFRIAHKMNQQQAAAQTGYKRAYYGHVERGYREGSAVFWQQLQDAFKLTDKEIEELKQID